MKRIIKARINKVNNKKSLIQIVQDICTQEPIDRLVLSFADILILAIRKGRINFR